MSLQQAKGALKRIAVFGLGRFGFGLAVRLAELGADVLAVDSSAELVEEIDQRVARAICLDATNEFAMDRLDPSSIDLAVVCIGRNIEAGLLVTAVLQRLNVAEIWVRAIDPNQAQILEAMGVRRIVSLEKEMARQVAQEIATTGTQVLAPITANHSLAEVKAKAEFVGKTLIELDFRNRYGLNIVAIKSREVTTGPEGPEKVQVHVNDLPHADDVIQEGDVLVVIGSDDKIAELQTDLT
ncbi:MAG: potassium channel family protein [Planctomycetota bacterium]|jgi:trk system potassium uptake protein TrkA